MNSSIFQRLFGGAFVLDETFIPLAGKIMYNAVMIFDERTISD